MLNGLSLPIICATNLCVSKQWFVYLNEIIQHAFLQDDEKLLWMWFAAFCINNNQSSCSFTYEQLSHLVNKPTRGIHRILFRLKIMGLLQGNIPIWYGKLSLPMLHEMRTIKLVLPLKIAEKEFLHETILPPRRQRQFNLNLASDGPPIPRKAKDRRVLMSTSFNTATWVLSKVCWFFCESLNWRKMMWKMLR
ncbi:MAG: hypothetical protein BGO43_10540 [Gammaproteobacteria bacterium 39-13]|mgnify:CR=1 FL=1|nr:hypothetical protein [Gammaproteobacteria bacterium]OJV88285.1 MAG: hypothetical protein BGO43_10540 [Gammaproteobacteria bacterium 39-13]